MKSIVYWRVFVNSTKEPKVKKLLAPLLDILGESARVEKQETYWKDNALTDVNITQPIEFQNIESEILGVLKTSSMISNNWNLTLPEGLSNTTGIVLSAVADNTSMNGIAWVSFDVVNE
jgi:hypothetical protein